jgi:hypothetical protein
MFPKVLAVEKSYYFQLIIPICEIELKTEERHRHVLSIFENLLAEH